MAVRRRNPKKPTASKSARLEEKLDGLVSLLKAGAQSDAAATDSQAIVATYDSAHHSSVQTNEKSSRYSQNNTSPTTSVLDDQLPNPPVLATGSIESQGTLSNSSQSLLRDMVEPSALEAEQYLTIFRDHKTEYLPFIYIPLTTTADQLRQERPFLWLCVMMVASRSTSQQQVLGNKVRDKLAQDMVVKSEQNIDLLLGLLVYVGWYGAVKSQYRSSVTDSFPRGLITKCTANIHYPFLPSLLRP